MGHWNLSPNRRLTEAEKALVWKKPASHAESDAERRICEAVKQNWNRGEMKITNILLEGDAGSGKTQLAKALSADFGLPYTKITCFANMDKSDILGAILPVAGSDNQEVQYQYYPSEIVQAYENGWLLEIQEPTVIRDAAVLMALNSALEPDGSINLPTRIVHRHPDFIAVITTNRGYNGCRPLNEALRDRIQHAEKMDLPSLEVMVERAACKTGCTDTELLQTFARAIIALDKSAKANAIKDVAGMRSYFYWIDAALQGTAPIEALYHKVIYKMTTDEEEISLLEQALKKQNLLSELETMCFLPKSNTNGEELKLRADGNSNTVLPEPKEELPPSAALKRRPDSKGRSDSLAETTVQTEQTQTNEDGTPIYHELSLEETKQPQEEKKSFRKQLNHDAREAVKGSIHEKIGMIVHRPEATEAQKDAYRETAQQLRPVILELSRKTQPLLEHEVSVTFSGNRVYGTAFHAEKTASPDLRYFSRKNPPEEKPSLAVALRIDQSASMNSFGRLEAARHAAVAVNEFCKQCEIPLLIYGDTADRSPKEKMSLYSYIDWEKPKLNEEAALMGMESISNNRDGMALRVFTSGQGFREFVSLLLETWITKILIFCIIK
ncbi:hypothetical protein C823_006806 [Eubacterium plexicaudatum ASF492]|uniref:ATPase dynein-related AAA domain-containing protein n=1 Tax=Eubacterium plexicaudatum ASF492 TaxID=1235802 RepID=N2A2I7_9FIRM|nr:hypothetical protein C823_006806 [Eubacterium plexicaudatum ASF492]